MCFRFDAQGRSAVRGVNVTLGLPIVRTSVEHGTAFEIAGRGRADPSSMADAAVLAARMVRGREVIPEAGRKPGGAKPSARSR